MADDQKFPYVVSEGLTFVFRVRHMDIGTYHIEQKVTAATETEPEKWQCLAISKHFDASEAIEVMLEAQMAYAVEIRTRQNAIRREMSNGVKL